MKWLCRLFRATHEVDAGMHTERPLDEEHSPEYARATPTNASVQRTDPRTMLRRSPNPILHSVCSRRDPRKAPDVDHMASPPHRYRCVHSPCTPAACARGEQSRNNATSRVHMHQGSRFNIQLAARDISPGRRVHVLTPAAHLCPRPSSCVLGTQGQTAPRTAELI
ncbi:hypothetical protein L226DRAFT_269278 [Lentinus tigrinus ALCF2SS1-7]|uniref:Uncharacterized protein n=1 Tax=Lentinus tigrinus ALCF2SS1-6 TaxID=1328759 RepID=A0A5C2RTX1_9APHY|nr:hypothetical protein L227DRAFT_349725 [Lentinus tigrinus ALCF2SS1-6]RPD69621.1 hypothetical protein L226DRAFT_269278 [Lentinus tigrinus ALCF2SS1-7]